MPYNLLVLQLVSKRNILFLCPSLAYITINWGTASAELCLLGSKDTNAIWVKMAMGKAHSRFNCNKQNHITSVQNKFIKNTFTTLAR